MVTINHLSKAVITAIRCVWSYNIMMVIIVTICCTCVSQLWRYHVVHRFTIISVYLLSWSSHQFQSHTQYQPTPATPYHWIRLVNQLAWDLLERSEIVNRYIVYFNWVDFSWCYICKWLVVRTLLKRKNFWIKDQGKNSD